MSRRIWLIPLCVLLLMAASAAYAQNSPGDACSITGALSLTNKNPAYILACNGSTMVLGETFTSTGLVGVGTSSPSAALDVQTALTASGGVAYGTRLQQTLTAAANNNVLTALYINPTFTNGSYTGVADNGLIVASGYVGIGTTSPKNSLHIYTTAITDGLSIDGTNAPSITFRNAGVGLANLGVATVVNDFVLGAAVNDLGLEIGHNFLIGTATSSSFVVQNGGNVGISNTSPGALLDIGSAGTTLGTMRLEGNTSGYVQLQSAAAAGSWSLTLPTGAGTSGYVLSTNGSGVTSWIANGGAINLGTAASSTNPQRSGQMGTGLFSATTNTVSIAAGTTDEADFASTGLNLPVATESYQINGVNALWQDNTNFNTAVGDTAFSSHVLQTGGGTNGQSNVAVGYQALNANTTGLMNTALGASTLTVNTVGVNNTAVGEQALQLNTTGFSNTAIGQLAMANNTTGQGNTTVGEASLQDKTTGVSNAAFGQVALNNNTVGSYNTALGQAALYNNLTGNSNVAVGQAALYVNTTGGGNTAVGVNALNKNTTGSNNTVLGQGVAGTTLATGSNNILIGTSGAVDTLASSTSNFLNIGNVIFATGMTGSLVSPAGKVGIGTTSPVSPLQVVGTSGTNLITVGIASDNSDTIEILGDNATLASASGKGLVLSAGTVLYLETNGGTNQLVINSNGNVGIGTASPNTNLDLGTGFMEWGGESRVASDFTKTSNATLSAITGLSATLVTGKTYAFEILLYTTEGAGGVQVDLNGGAATATAIVGECLLFDNKGIQAETRIAALNTVLCNSTAPTKGFFQIKGTITVNAGGTFIPEFSQSASSGTSSVVKAGSTMILSQIN